MISSSLPAQMRARLEEALREQGRPAQPWPYISEELLGFLEDLYPPRCIERNETTEDHLRYAGMVELVTDMRFHFNQQLAIGVSLSSEDTH